MDKARIKNIVREVLSEIKINDPNLHRYSFKDLTKFLKLSDTTNPNKKQMEEAEKVLFLIGFVDEEGSIRNNFQPYKTTDGKTLEDLEDWFEENMS